MSRATQAAKIRERASTGGKSRFLRTKANRPIPLKERSVELNLARKIHGKRRSKKNLEGLYDVVAPGSHILKVSPTTSTFKELGKPVVTVKNSETELERQTPLKAYADRRGPRSGEKLVEELIQSHVKEFTRKQKGDKKMKHRKRDPGSGVSSKSNISRVMRGRVPKIPNFLAIRNQQPETSTVSHSEQPTTSSATKTAAKQPQRSSDRNRRSPSYYGFESPSPVSTIAPPPKRTRRAVDVENYQPSPESIVESAQHNSRPRSISFQE